MNDLENFFHTIVSPAMNAWRDNPVTEWNAKNAASELNNMAERYFHYWKSRDVSKLFSANSPHRFRVALVLNQCPDFQLIWDIADAHKHVELDRTPRQITRSNQTGTGSLGWGQARWGEGIWGGRPQLVVTLDDGGKRAFSSVAENVMTMWDGLMR